MRAGLAALTTDYTTLAEDLAGHGYVVVGFDAPYPTSIVVLPDGTVIPRTPQNDADLVGGPQKEALATRLLNCWSADMSFALDQLREAGLARLVEQSSLDGCDMKRIGVLGALAGCGHGPAVLP